MEDRIQSRTHGTEQRRGRPQQGHPGDPTGDRTVAEYRAELQQHGGDRIRGLDVGHDADEEVPYGFLRGLLVDEAADDGDHEQDERDQTQQLVVGDAACQQKDVPAIRDLAELVDGVPRYVQPGTDPRWYWIGHRHKDSSRPPAA